MITASPVPLLQNSVEFEEVLRLYRYRKPRKVLEIGTYHGGSLYHWLQNAQPGTTIVTVDSYRVGVDNRHLYPEWTPGDVTLHVIEGDSRHHDTVAAVAEHGPYDFCFIDADHSYEAVLDDWRNYGPLVNGLVCFHDIVMLGEGVPRLWREIKDAGHRTREIVGPHQPGPRNWGLEPDTPWGGIGVVEC